MPEDARSVGGHGPEVERQAFVLAVREHHQGTASTAAHEARLALVDGHLAADMPLEAIELLEAAVIDASRLFGPSDIHTIECRLLLGEAHLRAEDVLGASSVLLTLLDDVLSMPKLSDSQVATVRMAAASTHALYQAEFVAQACPLLVAHRRA
jgi:hypothetical protein